MSFRCTGSTRPKQRCCARSFGAGRRRSSSPSRRRARPASHHWARLLRGLGHEVVLLPPQYIKPYIKHGKNDAIDAAAICEAMSRPGMRFVPIKSAESQAALMLLRVRDLLIKQRTMLSNAMRGHAAEFGVVAAKGPLGVAELLQHAHSEAAGGPALAQEALGLVAGPPGGAAGRRQ